MGAELRDEREEAGQRLDVLAEHHRVHLRPESEFPRVAKGYTCPSEGAGRSAKRVMRCLFREVDAHRDAPRAGGLEFVQCCPA